MNRRRDLSPVPAEESAGRWADYYEETDPEERWLIFSVLEAEETDRETLAFRRQLYKERYHDPKHPDRVVDWYLWKCVYLPGLYKKRRIGKKAFRRELEQTLKDLHLSDPAALSERERQILRLEFRNAARRYLDTCRGDSYANRFMGMVKASMKEKYERAGEEIWMMSRGLALAAGEEERMELWCRALYEELCAFNTSAAESYRKLEN